MEEAQPLAFLSLPTAQGGITCQEVKGSLSLKLAQSSKAVRPTNKTPEGGNSSGEDTIQYGKGTFNGGTRTELNMQIWSKLRGGDSQSRGHTEMPSTVAERPAPRETEEMKFRVNKQRLYPHSAWLKYCHNSGLIYPRRVGLF